MRLTGCPDRDTVAPKRQSWSREWRRAPLGAVTDDPGPMRYARLGRDATDLYLPALQAICPPAWEPSKRADVAQFILATLRGLLVDRLTAPEANIAAGGLHVLLRALPYPQGGCELLGSGAYWHELPGERDQPKYSGRSTLSGSEGRQPYVLLPVIPN
jgi:hypothetical protein